MKIKHKGVIFDLDGTLIDTLEDIGTNMNRALRTRGFPELPIEQYRDKVGWGIKRLAFLALPEEARQEETAALVSGLASGFYAENPLVYTKPYPGIIELIAVLKRRKIKTAVLSNKPDAVAQKVIAGLFPLSSFDIVQGEVSGKKRKPDPGCVWDFLVSLGLTPSDVIFAGDSEVDMETALASGCFPMGVSWGYRSEETIVKAGARAIIKNPEELLNYL